MYILEKFSCFSNAQKTEYKSYWTSKITQAQYR